jgi:hypothetical protein
MIDSCADNAEITALNRSWSNLIVSIDIVDRNMGVSNASKLMKVMNRGFVAKKIESSEDARSKRYY